MTRAGDLLIVIPMKDPKASKTRLATCLSETERQDLALGLFRRTLDVIERADGAAVDILVVTESAHIATLCQGRSVRVLREDSSEGLNAACRRAARWAVDHGFSRMAILPADLALLSPIDIEQLVVLPPGPDGIALCEATDGGTNCLVLSPPDVIPFCYGQGSFRLHRRAAMAKGLACHIFQNSDMRFDIDTSQDLEQLRLFEGRRQESA